MARWGQRGDSSVFFFQVPVKARPDCAAENFKTPMAKEVMREIKVLREMSALQLSQKCQRQVA